MPVTDTQNVREIVTSAMRKLGVTGIGDTPSGEELDVGARQLERMLKAWQSRGHFQFTYTSGTLVLTTAASYTLDPVRPFRIVNARVKRSGIEIPMEELTRDEYDALPNKAATGLPTQFHYDRQREAARLLVWPVLATADGTTIEYTYEREVDDIDLPGQAVDVPAEWYEAAVYGLASRLIDEFAIGEPLASRVIARAEDEFRNAIASDREGSVFFGGDY